MEPGVHQLALRCVSRTCGAVLDEVQLTIHIRHPWWNSWWMWLIYICLVALAFYGAWRMYQLHTKYMRLVLNNPGITAKPDVVRNVDAPNPAEEPHDEEGSAFIEKVTQLVVDNLSDTDFTIDRLCREMAMSRTLFYVKLKSYTGKSPQDFIRIIRLERAAALLRKGRQVTDAAALAGFDNPKYFSTVFKKYFGVSPSKY
jgi:AraC-like DNA-binding protein